jgi:TRAP-type C4-dicarboxylate transport system substrate-binding protein
MMMPGKNHKKRKEGAMKRNKWACMISFVLLIFVLSVFNAYALQEGPIKLLYSTFFPPDNRQAQLGESWAKEIEKRTNGRVKIAYIPSGTFVKADEVYEGVFINAIDIGMSAFAYNRERFPCMEAIDLPLGYPSGRVATAVINDFYRRFRPKELSDVKVLYLHAHGPGLLHSKKPVSRLEDLRGMRIRCTAFSAKIVRALGAEPMVAPQGYTFALLADNYVDATCSPMEVLQGWHQAEVIDYTTACPCIGYTSGFYVVMNLKKWRTLPPDIQKAFEEVSAEWIDRHAEAWDTMDDEGRKYTLSLGNKIIVLPDEEGARWCKTIQSVIDDYIKRAKEKGLSGQQYVETIRTLIKKHNAR